MSLVTNQHQTKVTGHDSYTREVPAAARWTCARRSGSTLWFRLTTLGSIRSDAAWYTRGPGCPATSLTHKVVHMPTNDEAVHYVFLNEQHLFAAWFLR